MVPRSDIMHLERILVEPCTFIMFSRVSGKSQAGADIDTHLSPPVEPIAYRRGEIDTKTLGEISSKPYVGKRSKFTKFEVCTTFDKDGCNPVAETSTPLHTKARTYKEHRVNLITVRCGKAGVESGLTPETKLAIKIKIAEILRTHAAAPLQKATVATLWLTSPGQKSSCHYCRYQ